MKNLIISFLKTCGVCFNSDLQKIQDELKTNKEELASVKNLLTPENAKKVLDPNLYEFPEKDLKIRVTKAESYKDTLRFHTNKGCWEKGPADITSFAPFSNISVFYGNRTNKGDRIMSSGSKDYWEEKDSNMVSFLETIFKLGGISRISSENSMTFNLTKSGAIVWEEILPEVLKAIASTFPNVEKTGKEISEAKQEVEKTENQLAES
jgi:hypothetical protein